MNKLLILLIYLFLFQNSMSGQTYNLVELVNEFEKSNLISENAKSKILSSKSFAYSNKDFRLIFLYELIEAYSNEIISASLGDTVKTSSILLMGRNEELEKALREENSNCLELSLKLTDMNIISKDIHEGWFSDAANEKLGKLQMLSFYFSKVQEKEQLKKTNDKIEIAIPKLIKAEILPSNFYKQHKNYRNEVIQIVDLFKYSENAAVIKLSDIPTDIDNGYHKIYDILNKVTNEIDFSIIDLSFERSVEDGSNIIATRIGIECNNKIYRDTFRHDYFGEKHSYEERLVSRFQIDMINIINSILLENNSLFKLYYINSGDGTYDFTKAGFVYLKRKQYYAVREVKTTYFSFGPFPCHHINNAIADDLIKEGKRINLIPKDLILNPDSIRAFKEILIKSKILYKHSFAVLNEKYYTNMLKEMSRVIGNEFQVTEIEERWHKKELSVDLAYKLNQQQRQSKIEIDGTRICKAFNSDLKGLLKKQNLSKSLVWINEEYGQIGIGYLDEDQIRYIKQNGLSVYNYMK